jgi:deazaflavin-dependent oxidoreductase (nitroreductase family)
MPSWAAGPLTLRPMHDANVKILSLAHTTLFRLTGGIIGSRLVRNDMLLLTTTGRISGRRHTVPLLYLDDGNDVVVIASYGGRPGHPDWYRNLQNEPEASIQVSGDRTAVTAETMGDGERGEWWPKIVSAYSDYEVYQSRTERRIPVVRLRSTE